MRAEVITGERRRRNSNSLAGVRSRLRVDESLLDRENFAYRIVNDEGTRLHELTVLDDWEVVHDRSGTLKVDGTGMGAEVAMPVGVGGEGKAVRGVLLRKPKHYYEEDERAKQRRIDDLEAGLKAGVTPGSGTDARTYVPKGGIVFDHGSKG